MIAKATSLVSATVASTIQLARINAREVGGPLTTHGNTPVVAAVVVNVVIALHVDPPSRLRSIFTSCPTPKLWVHVMLCVSPLRQVTAVFGLVTVIDGATIENGTSLISVVAPFNQLT